MATDLNDETFLGGTIDDLSLLTGINKLPNASQEDGKERKSLSASKSPKPGSKTTPKLRQNENSNSVKTEPKKAGRMSKTKREPLKVLNNKEKTADVAPKKKTEVKNNAKNDPPQRKSVRSVDKGMPKIVVFQNGTSKAKAQKTPVQKLPKVASSGATTRRSLPEGRKPQASEVSRGGKARHTLGGIPKTPNKAEKSLKSPAKEKVEKLPKSKSTEPEANESLAKLEKIFPNVDPDFLKSQLSKFKGSLQDTTQFLINKEKENDLPTKDDYLKRRRVEEIQATFKQNFSVEEFLSMFPNPWEHFSNKRVQRSATYVQSSLHYLKSKHKKHYLQAIQEAMEKNENCLYLADKQLSRKNRLLKMRATNRSKCECDASRPTAFDVQFMHEVVFIENEKEIKLHLKKVEMARHKKFKEAEKAETLLECLSCNNLSLLLDDTVNCPAHHVFCKDCLIKYVKIEMEKNDFKFKCLVKCEESFSVETLKSALSPQTLGGIIERNKKEAIKPEGIENLVSCPFCHNIFVAPDETQDLTCLNPNCLMESCRKCKKTSHMPWNCNEARVITEAPLEMDEEERSEKENTEDGEDEQTERDSETDVSLALGRRGEIFETDDHSGRHFKATVCSLCQQPFPGISHPDELPCCRCPRSRSFSPGNEGPDIWISECFLTFLLFFVFIYYFLRLASNFS